MTARCTGGTSAPDLGAAAVIEYTAGLLAESLLAYELPWLIPIIPLAGLAGLTLATFCASDPPAVPTFTAAEVNALLNLTLGADFVSGLSKFKDLVLNIIWYDNCRCTSGTLIPLTPPTQPAGTPTYSPPHTKGTPCRQTFADGVSCWAPSTVISTFPHDDGSHSTVASLLGGTVTLVSVEVFNVLCTGAGGTAQPRIDWFQSNGTLLSSTSGPVIALGSSGVFTAVPPPLATDFNVPITFTGSGTIKFPNSHIDRYCNGESPTLPVQPCPPDPATQAYLDLILNAVTLIQRQGVAFSYIASTVHAGLTGAGFINVGGLLGVEVAVTTDSATLGVEGTAPTELFDRGWITFATADGALSSSKLRHVHQLFMPCQAGIYTLVYYDLNPLITVSITELVREP